MQVEWATIGINFPSKTQQTETKVPLKPLASQSDCLIKKLDTTATKQKQMCESCLGERKKNENIRNKNTESVEREIHDFKKLLLIA